MQEINVKRETTKEEKAKKQRKIRIMTKADMKQVQITKETHQRLKMLATKHDVSITRLTEHALRAYLEATERTDEIEFPEEGEGKG